MKTNSPLMICGLKKINDYISKLYQSFYIQYLIATPASFR